MAVFDSERIFSRWVEKLDQALKSGYEGLRFGGNVFWPDKKDWEDFIDCEGKLIFLSEITG